MRPKGFSLVEILVAVTLLATVMVLAMNLLPTSALAVRQAEHRIAANQLCQSLLARASLAPFDDLVVGSAVDLDPMPLEDGTTLRPSRKVLAIGGPDPEDPDCVKRVVVTVRWSEARTQKDVDRVQEVWQEQWVSRVRR